MHTAYALELIERYAETLALVRAYREIQLADAEPILAGRQPAAPGDHGSRPAPGDHGAGGTG